MNVARELQEAYAAFARRDYAAAAHGARQVLAHSPDDPGALTLFGRLALVSHEPDVALNIFRGLIGHPQAGAATWLDLSQALLDLHREDEAVEATQQAIARGGGTAAHLRLGSIRLAMDEPAKAARAFRAALALDDGCASAYRGLSQAEEIAVDSPQARRMQELTATLAPREAAELHYSLAQMNRRAGRNEAFVHHLLVANGLQRRIAPGTRAQYDDSFDRLDAAFTPQAFERAARAAPITPTPIFVLGMPRSGTTLVEQLLGAHPQVTTGGELDYMRGPLRQAVERRTHRPFPLGFEELTAEALDEIARAYGRRLALIAKGAAHVTDKTPGNFHVLGLLRLLFPRARIVHVARDPMDTCFSILQYPFDERSPHTCDTDLLAHSYGRYVRLMRRWEELFAGEFITVRYEELVASPAAQGRRLFEFCGLDWSDDYLHARQSGSTVRTFSATQVRRPIYRSSIGAWRPFAEALAPLRLALEREGVEV